MRKLAWLLYVISLFCLQCNPPQGTRNQSSPFPIKNSTTEVSESTAQDNFISKILVVDDLPLGLANNQPSSNGAFDDGFWKTLEIGGIVVAGAAVFHVGKKALESPGIALKKYQEPIKPLPKKIATLPVAMRVKPTALANDIVRRGGPSDKKVLPVINVVPNPVVRHVPSIAAVNGALIGNERALVFLSTNAKTDISHLATSDLQVNFLTPAVLEVTKSLPLPIGRPEVLKVTVGSKVLGSGANGEVVEVTLGEQIFAGKLQKDSGEASTYQLIEEKGGSPYIISSHGVGESADGKKYLLLEKMDGDFNAKDYTWKDDHLLDLASGLDFLHNTIKKSHGDIKPGNLFYKEGKAKIGDLGSSGFGTPYYNRWSGREGDIFALGLVAAEKKVGKSMFDFRTEYRKDPAALLRDCDTYGCKGFEGSLRNEFEDSLTLQELLKDAIDPKILPTKERIISMRSDLEKLSLKQDEKVDQTNKTRTQLLSSLDDILKKYDSSPLENWSYFLLDAKASDHYRWGTINRFLDSEPLSFVDFYAHMAATKIKENKPRQQNLWVQSGVGSAPNV